jgi:3-hydroxybutyryl-CoA dehydratase
MKALFMSDSTNRPSFGQGLWFEEFTVGLEITTRGRTITEADIVAFAGLSGDFNPVHTNVEYAKRSEFGQRVAHGTLVFSIATGLAYQLGAFEGTVLALRGFEMKLSEPVKIGDTITLHGKVAETKTLRGSGLVVFEVRVTNQEDKVVQRGTWTLLMRTKPKDA